MSLANPHHRLADKATELIVRHDIRLIVIDDAEQLNETGFAFLCALSGKTGRPLLLIGDEHRLRQRMRTSTLASARFALLRRFVLFWSRRKKNDV